MFHVLTNSFDTKILFIHDEIVKKIFAKSNNLNHLYKVTHSS